MIEFFKMSGSGNDFVLIDNRNQALKSVNLREFAKKICERKISVGADGLIVVEHSNRANFRWRFFNADGSDAEMCGNGGRCAARFAYLQGIAGQSLSFETMAGIIEAQVEGDQVKLRLTDAQCPKLNQSITVDNRRFEVDSINTGVPHVVCFVDDLDNYDVFHIGKIIRYHERYQPDGTNANFVEVVDKKTLKVRTYERGVEDETMACGTGSVAAALISSWKGFVESPVDVHVKSREILKVYFGKTDRGFEKIYLEGKAAVVYQGLLWDEAHQS